MSKKKAIGIDLGTSKCCVGVVRNGKVEILENERGNKTTPSHVAFTNTERLVGDDAKDQAMRNPANSVSGIKRIMCKALNDSAKMTPTNDINANGETCFQVSYKMNTQTLLLQQISAMLLTKMKSVAEDHLGSSVEEAVISVPASFSNAQRQATKDAAAIAGLKVLALINEPTAAAIAYQTNRRSKGKETIVVVDFGAGKLDVSVVTVDDGYILVNGVSGSTDIGGNDVDEILMTYIIDQYKEKYNHDPPLGRGVMERLRSSCENIKKFVSFLPEVQETLDCFGEKNILHITMSSDKFKNMLPHKFRECLIGCLQDSLKVARVHQNEISRVLLVGGSTRLLVIQQWLQEFFECPIDRSVNPDEAVTVGASVQAALLSCDYEIKELVVQDAIGTNFYWRHEEDKYLMNIFGRDYLAAVPSKEWSPIRGLCLKQSYQVCEEVTGKKRSYSPNGTFPYSSDLCWRVDKCGIFNVCTRVGPNQDGSYEFKDILKNVPGKLPKKKLRKLVEEEKKFRKDDHEEKCRKQAMGNLEWLCFRYHSYLQKSQVTEFFPESIHRFAKQVEENIHWLNSESSVSVTECRERQKVLEQKYIKVPEEIRRHKEQLEKECGAAVTELVKHCLELPFTLTGDVKTLNEVRLLVALKNLHELVDKMAAPKFTLSKEECVDYIAALQSKISEHDYVERTKGTKSSTNDMHGVFPDESSVDISSLLLKNSGYLEGSIGSSNVCNSITQTSINIDTTNTPQDLEKISSVLSNLKLQVKETPKDGHCLLHSVIESWKGQTDGRSNLQFGVVINEAKKELNENMHNYRAFLALENDNEDIYQTYMDNYFTHKNYDHDLGDLIPTALSNALSLEINIIQELCFGKTKMTSIKPDQRTNRNGAQHAIFIHLKDSHYSALVPLNYFSKTHRMNGGPNQSNFCTNKLTPLNDAPDTCIYTEDISDNGRRSRTIATSNKKVADRSAPNSNSIHENSSRPMCIASHSNEANSSFRRKSA